MRSLAVVLMLCASPLTLANPLVSDTHRPTPPRSVPQRMMRDGKLALGFGGAALAATGALGLTAFIMVMADFGCGVGNVGVVVGNALSAEPVPTKKCPDHPVDRVGHAALGVGVAGVVLLSTGIALYVVGKKDQKRLELGANALRLRF